MTVESFSLRKLIKSPVLTVFFKQQCEGSLLTGVPSLAGGVIPVIMKLQPSAAQLSAAQTP